VDDLYSLLRRLDNDSIVLDLGCGHGSFQYEACRGRIIAIDLTLPEKTALRSEAVYLRADSSAIPLPSESA
jgi:precorrin-6B methylase 2